MVDPCRPLRPSPRGLSDAVIDPIGGPALFTRPHIGSCRCKLLCDKRSQETFTDASLISVLYKNVLPTGDSAILHPSAGAE